MFEPLWELNGWGLARTPVFFEIGYVFERELIYRSDRRELDLQDALMLRYGVAF